jgi:hypothetical protein
MPGSNVRIEVIKVECMLSMRFVNSLGISLLLILLTSLSFGQDGSNMRYLKPDQLTNKELGKWVHLDFDNNSFAVDGSRQRRIDSITVEIDRKKFTFLEHRVDDGFNNWFEQQYLESTDTFNGLKIRWVKNKLLSIDGNEIKVGAYFHYYTPTGNFYQDKTFTKEISFKKELISVILVRTENQ